MGYSFGKKSLERMEGVNSDLIKVVKKALEISEKRGKRGVDFIIPPYGGLRTAEEQNELYKKGRSKLDGFKKESYHQSGNALDVVPYVDGAPSWDYDELMKVAVCMLQAANDLGIHITWGGSWTNGWDAPHYQVSR